jgi:hypothetical protein
MQTAKRHLTRHRRQRIVLWTLAMLTWIAAVLLGDRNVAARHWRQRGDISFDALKRMVIDLMIIRAGELARTRRRTLRFHKRGRDLRLAHLYRRVLGSKLRRALKRKDIAARVALLISVLRNLDAYARPLAARLKRGLTRLWAITAMPMSAEAVFRASAPLPALADSS